MDGGRPGERPVKALNRYDLTLLQSVVIQGHAIGVLS